jgi:sodium transport system permease protein
VKTRLSHVTLTLGKELRETLRDRRTLAMMVLFPLVVYPLLSLLVSQLVLTREKNREAQPSAVAVSGSGPVAEDLRRRIREQPKLFRLEPRFDADAIEAGRLDAALVVGDGGESIRRRVQILYDASRDESRGANERLSDLLDEALPEGCARFDVKRKDLASGTKLGGYLLSKALPLALVLMVLLGAFYPAIDVTAGERERGTLETVLVAPIGRFELLLGKVLAVACIAGLTGLLNLASMSLTLIHAVQLADAKAPLLIPWNRAAAATLVLAPSAFLFGALFVAIGSVARGFKEAQSFLMPVYFLCIAPALIGGVGEYRLAGAAALVPAMNITLLARELLLGTARLGPALLALGSTALYGGLALAFAARVYDSERFLDPAGARDRKRAGRAQAAPPTDDPPSAAMALTAFALGFLLLVFVFLPWQKRNLVQGLLGLQYLGMLGLTVVMARVARRPLAGMIALRRPANASLAGAVLIGASAWAAVALLSDWLVPVPKEVIEALRKALLPEDASRGLAANLLLIALTPAICEEVLFRGVILRGLATRMAPSAAIVITGLLFGIFHLDVHRLLPTALLGILLSWLAFQSGSLVPSMVAHFLNNAILVTLSTSKLDERLGKVGGATGVAVFALAVVVLGVGVYLVRRGGKAPRPEPLL